MRNMRKAVAAAILVFAMSLTLVPAAFALEPQEQKKEIVTSHSENWMGPNKWVEITEYDLGDGFTAIKTVVDEYSVGLERASGTKEQTSTYELKHKKELVATVTARGKFSYDGKTAKVVSSSYSRSIEPGYTETQWSTSKQDSSLLTGYARVTAILMVENDDTGRSFTGVAEVTCSKDGK
ncbi:hypothetical protein B5G40_04960 [Flavonifractor sp. An9]|mgnify:CR=1 FL=1|nr:hypothetical protein B5G40_04960 [Flavonifractor sp. An9]